MKKFEIPEVEIQKFSAEDVIAASGNLSGETPED